MSVAGGSMEVVSVGGVMYMKGLIKSKDGKPWVKIDPNGTDEFSKRMAPQLKSAADLRSQVEVRELRRAAALTPAAGPGWLAQVRLDNGAVLLARTVILATGARWRHMGVPGEENYRNKGVT